MRAPSPHPDHITHRGVAAVAGGAALALAALTVLPVSAAHAAETNTWSEIGVSGAPRAYTGTVSLPGGFPATTFTSTAREATRISGASTWLPATSDPGAIYGTSRNLPYLNQRPASDNAASPAVTTYTFDRPTPAAGWSFVFGDVDSDRVSVTGIGVNGAPVAASALGFQSAFNYCRLAGGPSCDSDNVGDLPVYSENGSAAQLVGNVAATDGASGWFSPTVPLISLTVTFQWQAGLPVYQTWFVDKTRSADGVVTVDDEPIADAEVSIVDRNDEVVAQTQTDPAGEWSVDQLVADSDYTVVVDPPVDVKLPAEPVTFDLTTADATGITSALAAAAVPTPSPTPGPEETTGPTVSAADTLPETGPNPTGMLVIGAGALVLGLLVLSPAVAKRRRR